MRETKFDIKNLIKLVAAIAIPVALQNLLSSTGSMVDTMMLAPLKETTVSAVGLCAQFSTLMFSCYWGFVGGGVLFISQHFGVNDEDGVDRFYGIMITCLLIVATVFSCSALFFPEFVMNFYTDKKDIIDIGVRYLRIVGFAYPFEVCSIGISMLMRTTNQVKIPLYSSILSVSVNVLFNWLLIEGHLGMPALGVEGAAFATLLSALVNFGSLYLFGALKKFKFLYQIRKHFKWDINSVKMFFVKCAPIIANEMAMGIANLFINRTLGHQSKEAIAAVAVFRTLEGMVIGFFAGFSNASSVLVGTCVGAGEHKTAYERAKRIVYLCQLSIFIVMVILICVNYPLLHAMSLTGTSYKYGLGLLLIYSAFGIIRMGNWTMNDTYRSAGDAVTGTVLEIVFMYVLVLPCMFVANKVLHMPFLAVFACCYIDEPIRYIIMQIHMYSGKWIRPVTKEGKEALEEFRKSRNK